MSKSLDFFEVWISGKIKTFGFVLPKASDPVPLTAPSLPPVLSSAPQVSQIFPLPVPVSSTDVSLILQITVIPNKYLSYDSPNRISSSVQTSSALPPDQELSSVSNNLRFTLLKDNPSGNCRKWHIPHSFYLSINLSDKTVVNFNIPYFLTVLVFPPLMDCDFLNQLIQKRGGKLVNGTVFLD
mgnify:CR=1 FL=1